MKAMGYSSKVVTDATLNSTTGNITVSKIENGTAGSSTLDLASIYAKKTDLLITHSTIALDDILGQSRQDLALSKLQYYMFETALMISAISFNERTAHAIKFLTIPISVKSEHTVTKNANFSFEIDHDFTSSGIADLNDVKVSDIELVLYYLTGGNNAFSGTLNITNRSFANGIYHLKISYTHNGTPEATGNTITIHALTSIKTNTNNQQPTSILRGFSVSRPLSTIIYGVQIVSSGGTDDYAEGAIHVTGHYTIGGVLGGLTYKKYIN